MNKLQLLYHPLDKSVRLGRVNNKGVSIGEKPRDVTSDFLNILERKFPIGSKTEITDEDGKVLYKVYVVATDVELVKKTW